MNKKKNTAILCVSVAGAMLALSFASVPLYRIFCQTTGYGGTTQKVEKISDTILNDEIIVRFDANVSSGLNWEFEPNIRSIKVKIGEVNEIAYQVKNLSNSISFGTASFNVSPHQAGIYFNKIECFCYTQQKLKINESQEMPVAFFISPDIVNDTLFKNRRTITLSYTFFPDDNNENKLAQNNNSNLNR